MDWGASENRQSGDFCVRIKYMNENKKDILTLALALALFCLSFLYVKNEVCCMFSGMRHRGFPYQIISISKETEDFEEAEKIYSLNDFELLNQGWKLRIDSSFNPLFLSIPSNLIFSLVLSRGLIFTFEKIKEVKEITK